MIISIFALSILGLIVCTYGFWVELNIEKDANYKAACDISDKASCSKAFTSPYGKLLGFSNIYMGFMLYCALAFCAYFDYEFIILAITTAAAMATIFLAYILFVHIKTVCIVCTTTYLINGLLLLAAIYHFFIR